MRLSVPGFGPRHAGAHSAETLMARAAAVALLLLLAFAALAQDAIPVPKLAARVTDLTGTLTAAQREALEGKLAAFEKSRGSQVAVLLVPSIGQETIEEFAGRVTDEWKLGRQGVDDGVLFVVALKERRMRIHTGRGVQGTLTDALSRRIVADLVAPRFRNGDFAGGIEAGVDAILKAIEGEELPLPDLAQPSGKVDVLSSSANFLMLAFFLIPVVGMMLRGIFGRFFGATATSGITGIAAWLVLGSLSIGIIAAIIAFVFTIAGGAGMTRRAGRGGWGGVYIPSGGGSWGGGGGLGGGGWSGGGGGFDGGGASGSW
ncbi:MAG TPA: TPM domain-containing protein [Usitatibacter sp.]|nr:TPM domain-containing protein [Usitatibacter sp.]